VKGSNVTENKMQFDVVVIGAGAGGLFTAARLAHRGYRTLVVERQTRSVVVHRPMTSTDSR